MAYMTASVAWPLSGASRPLVPWYRSSRPPTSSPSTPAPFAISALVVAGFVARSAQPTSRRRDSHPAVSYVSSLAEGFRYLARDRLLIAMSLMVLVTNFIDQAGGTVLIPVWAHDIMHSPLDLGFVGGASSFGAVGGNALTTRLARRPTYALGFLIAGAPRFLIMAMATSPAPVLAVMFLAGLGVGGINPVVGAVEYERVPRALQARVLGAVGASRDTVRQPGRRSLVSAVGARAALASAGIAYGTVTLPPFVFPVRRQMNAAQRHLYPAPPAARLQTEHEWDRYRPHFAG